MDSDEIKRIFAEKRENNDKLNACPRHLFAPSNVKLVVGGSAECERCGGKMAILAVNQYIRGYEAAGGDANDILRGFRDPGVERVCTCPQCKGTGYIETQNSDDGGQTYHIDYHDCPLCEGNGYTSSARALGYLKTR